MRKLLLLLPMVVIALLAGSGCDEKSKQNAIRTTVDYELDRQMTWNPETRKLKGMIRVKIVASAKEMPPQANAYGIAFELSPGDRNTVLVMTDGEGVYYTGDYPDLPMQLPRLLSLQKPDVSGELIDPEMCAASEVALSAEPLDGKLYLLFSCYAMKAGWLHDATIEIPAGKAFVDTEYVSVARGREEYRRQR